MNPADKSQQYIISQDEMAKLLASLPQSDKGMVPFLHLVGAMGRFLEQSGPGFDRNRFAEIVLAGNPDLEFPSEDKATA